MDVSAKDKIYSRYSVPSDVDALMGLLRAGKLSFGWVLEAGCHSAADTLRLAAYPEFKKFYLFEPDPISYQNALNNLRSLNPSRYVIRQVAVADKRATYNLISDGELGGEGSLITEENNLLKSEKVYAVTIDEVIDSESERNGLLWLDVEGFAYPALKGGLKTLDVILAAKIEVEYTDMNEYRKTNYRRIITLMSKKGFVIKKANLNPCNFGDLLFIHKSNVKFIQVLSGDVLKIAVCFLHGFLYPLMRKPGY
jgi:FkbM family methyltransferase